MGNRWLGALTVLGFGLALAPRAEAVPAFARELDFSCRQCHSAWPMLNKFGREFKENGYRLDRGKEAPKEKVKSGEKMFPEKNLPVSARYVMRPYDKKNSDARYKFRVGHELEVFLTGSAFKNISFFAEIEAEDEEEFELFTSDLLAGWHPHRAANIIGGWSSVFRADPYNTFSPGHRRLTRAQRSPLAAAFKGGYPLEASTQFLTLYGRAKGLFYSASLSTGAEDFEGKDKEDFLVRAAFDIPGGLMVGAFNFRTRAEDQMADFNRRGFDFQFELGGFVLYGVWYQARDELSRTATVEKEDNAWYVEAFAVISKDKEPILAPLVRYETVESNARKDSTSAIDVALIVYPTPNTHLTLDYFKQTSVPAGRAKGDRFTVQLSVAF